MDLLGGGVVGVAFSDLEKAFIKVYKTIARFKSTFKRLKTTMDAIDLIFKDTRKLEQILERPQPELDFFADELKRGTELILLCSRIKSWNLYKKYVYSKKLQSFDQQLTRFFQINVQAHQLRSIRQVSKGVSDVSVKLDVVKGEILHDVLEKIDSMSVTCSSSCSSRKNIGSAYVGEIPELVLGLDLPLEELKVMLLKDNDVLPTVVVLSAPPGCGKTTLANMVCIDSTIKEKFKNIFFVTVSKAVNIQIAVKTIFKQKGCLDDLLEFRSDEDAINQLGQLLKQIGGGPDKDPILLVLDDVWSPGLEAFVQKFRFKEIPEYKILVTSRFESKLHLEYKLKLLDDKDAKDLFCHSVFPSGSEHPKISDKTVNKVVKACNGFPLALNVVGLSLRGKPEETWKITLNKWSKGRSSIFDSNSLLLNNLKTSLDALDEEKGMETVKEGFLDLGSFPEDQRISSTVLLDMWVESYDLDEQGMETYTNLIELSTRNLLNVVSKRKDDSSDLDDRYCNGHFVTQHDMLRELAIHQSSQEAIELRKRLITEIIGKGQPKDWVGMLKQPLTARLISISTDDTFSSSWPDIKLPKAEVLILNFRSKNYALPQFMEHMNQLKVLIVTNYGFCPANLQNFPVVGHLSSLKRIRLDHVSISSTLSGSFAFQLINLQKLSLTMCEIGNALDNCANMFPHLRDIEMEYCRDLVELPVGICDIVHLEKISITRCNELRVLPDEIGKLISLQSLRLNSCTELEKLPETIDCLQELSLLDISDCLSLSEMPIQMGDLKGLRLLHMRGCSGMDGLPASVEELEDVTVFCDKETAKLWEDYTNVEIILVKEDINLDWLNH